MNRILGVPAALALASAALGIAVAAPNAVAAPTCPKPSISISPSTQVGAGTEVTITGHNFSCPAKAGQVTVDVFNTQQGQQGNGPMVPLANDGSFTYTEKAFGDVGSTMTVRVWYGAGFKYEDPNAITIVSASNPPLPTAVPAGHVDVALPRHTATDTTAIAALGAAGVALLGGGLAISVRRRESRTSRHGR